MKTERDHFFTSIIIFLFFVTWLRVLFFWLVKPLHFLWENWDRLRSRKGTSQKKTLPMWAYANSKQPVFFKMDVWLNNHFPCKEFESSNWNNHKELVFWSSRYIYIYIHKQILYIQGMISSFPLHYSENCFINLLVFSFKDPVTWINHDGSSWFMSTVPNRLGALKNFWPETWGFTTLNLAKVRWLYDAISTEMIAMNFNGCIFGQLDFSDIFRSAHLC